ncbi:hypothetical protein B0T10DRAFT_551079 [Thelonectria olida]|uniref:DUF6594 domain-containing protein n=1 Tax=Thelonectria olida TaxID=1576542 RepID=A0A9P8VYS2_9HYPO|nr:hypothetical protein B0T10DRAFT_551079 [Thelonectria olida]
MDKSRNALDHDAVELEEVISQDEIDERAWKYTGYRSFANYVSSDTNFFVFRRFDRLNARVLLTLQAQLTRLEDRLGALDGKYSARGAGDINNGSIKADQPDRAAVIAEITEKIKEYNTVLLAHSELRAREPAPKRNITNIQNWFENNAGAIVKEEAKFINHREDLFTISTTRKPTIRNFLESHVVFRLHWLWKKEPPPDTRQVDRETRQYVNEEKIDLVATIAIIFVGLSMLIVPIWVLAIMAAPYAKLGVITCFIVVFLVVVLYATVATPTEALAASAAYSAVLMVFLQLGNSDTSS